ncbi:tol-pal system protein YbgF [Candidatus Latescibacterota bacterium]
MASCATHRDSMALRQELNAANARLAALESAAAQLDSLVREQQQLTMSMRATLGLDLKSQEDQLSSITARQDEINYLLHDLLTKLEAIQLYGSISAAQPEPPEQQPASSTIPSTVPQPDAQPAPSSISQPAPSPTPSPQTLPSPVTINPEDLYKAAIDDINRQGYALAESRLLTFLIQFPDHDLAGNAQYWLGEAAYGQEKYGVAIQEFDKLLQKYPQSPRIPTAFLKKGLSQMQTGDIQNAQLTFQELIKTAPDSPEATQAKSLIEVQ